tara:strand:+ start:2793 stop:3287 length:495 start_codon:yes stop_codon:yes gene_type:complete
MASNIRALVSNSGDGNWGVNGTATATDNKLDNANTRVFFPPGASKGTPPAQGASHMSPAASSVDLVGFTSKTQWMVQVNATNLGTGGTPSVTIHAMRPTGIEELVHTVTSTGSDSYGGFNDESIQGPVSYFRFTATASNTTNLDVDCYVIGWNYGDISDGFADA